MRQSIRKHMSMCTPKEIKYEYLESSGKNYFDLGFKPNENMSVYIEYYLLPDNQYYAPFGCAEEGYDNVYRLVHVDNDSDNPYFLIQWLNKHIKEIHYDLSRTALNEWIWFEKDRISNRMSRVVIEDSPQNEYFEVNKSMYLFADNYNGKPNAMGKCRIRKFVVEEYVDKNKNTIMDLEFIQLDGVNCIRNKVNGEVIYGSDNNFIGG